MQKTSQSSAGLVFSTAVLHGLVGITQPVGVSEHHGFTFEIVILVWFTSGDQVCNVVLRSEFPNLLAAELPSLVLVHHDIPQPHANVLGQPFHIPLDEELGRLHSQPPLNNGDTVAATRDRVCHRDGRHVSQLVDIVFEVLAGQLPHDLLILLGSDSCAAVVIDEHEIFGVLVCITTAGDPLAIEGKNGDADVMRGEAGDNHHAPPLDTEIPELTQVPPGEWIFRQCLGMLLCNRRPDDGAGWEDAYVCFITLKCVSFLRSPRRHLP